jgi:predicted NBD/HSP70 family sugar kinase
MTGEAPVASPLADHVFGVDIGGTNIKDALVDVRAGCLVGEPRRSLMPRPATPVDVAGTVAKMVADTGWCGRVGVTFLPSSNSGAAASVRTQHGMSYARWARRVSRYLQHVERLLTPDLFVVGGGVSSSPDRWVPLLEAGTPVRPAQFRAHAEIVGAGLAALHSLT